MPSPRRAQIAEPPYASEQPPVTVTLATFRYRDWQLASEPHREVAPQPYTWTFWPTRTVPGWPRRACVADTERARRTSARSEPGVEVWTALARVPPLCWARLPVGNDGPPAVTAG